MPSDIEVTNVGNPHAAPQHIIELLHECPLFHNFSATGLHLLANIAREKSIPAGTPLFVENMVAESFFIVEEGEIAITVVDPEGRSLPLVTLSRGASFGELGAICAGRRMCAAVAESDSSVLEVTRRDLGTLQQSKPQACVKLMINVNEMFARRLRESQNEFRRFMAWRLGE
jgi:CRP/FNR family transcriptional regulator, cyclic AMP receptor protein